MGVRACTTALALTFALVGCSSEEPPPSVLPSLPSAAPSAGPSPAAPLPSEAAPSTQAGASAFIRYYFQQVNAAYASGETRVIERFNGAQCDSCTNIVKDVRRLQSASHQVTGLRFKVSTVATAPALDDGSFIVDFRFSSDAYVERRADQKVVQEQPAQTDQDAQARVKQLGGTWTISGLRYV